MTLYAYIMTHDNGRAPNPYDDTCTLAFCMPMTRGAAGKGDYVVGLGCANFRRERGGWHIIYAMKVTETISFSEHAKRFPNRLGEPVRNDPMRALVSSAFAYWGREGPFLSDTPLGFLEEPFHNSSRGHRYRFTDEQVETFVEWFNEQEKGKQGEPFDREGGEDKRPRTSHRRHRPKKC